MPKLTIGDQSVTVGDEFLQLSPDQQNAAVAQIASQLGAKPAPAPEVPAAGGGFDRSDPRFQEGSMSAQKALEGIPVLGSAVPKIGAYVSALAHPLTGVGADGASISERAARNFEQEKAASAAFDAERPIESTAAKMIGGTIAMAPVMAAAPAAFGLTGTLPQMVARGAASGAAVSGVDAAVRGEDPATAATVGGIIGGAAGPVGKGVGKVVSAIADRVRPAAAVPQNVTRVGGVDIPLSQSQVTQNPAISAEEQILLRGGRGDAAQANAQGFKDLQDARISAARDEIAAGLDPTGTTTRVAPQDAAERIAAELIAQEQAARAAETQAAINVGAEGTRLARSFDHAGQMRGATPFDAAQSLSDRFAAGRDAAKADYRGKYDLTAEQPGEFAPGSAAGFRGDVEAGLQNAERPVSLDTTTPFSQKALGIIEKRMNAAGPGAPKAELPAGRIDPQHAQNVADIRAKFGDDVAAAYDRQMQAAADDAEVIPNKIRPRSAGPLDPHSVSVSGGASVDVIPKVVEASSLKTSADSGYDAALQPRDRSRAASAGQVNDIAKNLNPERLGRSAEADRGAPIVGPDSMVESGNGRVAALRQAYRENGPAAAKYRDWLASQGVDVSKFREPVLIRERATQMTPEQRQAFTVGANQGATLTMSAPERALADAKLISGDALATIKNPNDLASVENRDFVRQFAARLPQTEQGAFVNSAGQLSAEGATRVRNAVLAKAYGDSPVLTRIAESTHDDIKSISNALTTAAPEWAAIREGVASGAIPKEMDITADLLDAVARTAQIRSRGVGLAETVAQTDAFDKQSAVSEQIMRLFYDANGKRAASSSQVTQALRYYAQQAAKVEASPGLTLGLPQVTPADILDLAALKVSAPKAISPEVLATATKAAAAGEKVAAAAQTPGSGFTMRDVDQVRKELNGLYGDARRAMMAGGTGSDVYALEHIIDQFDARVERMIAKGKFSGDGPAVLQMQKDARASFADYKQKFAKRGAGDEVGAAVEKILGRFGDTKATPDTIVKLAYGSASEPGGQMPVQIAQRIIKIFGRNSEEFATYKQGLFSHLTQGDDVEKVAARIDAFLNGTKGKLLAQTVFEAPERNSLARYANNLRGIAPKADEPGAVAAAVRRYTGADGAPPASANKIINDLMGASGKGNGVNAPLIAAHLKGRLSPESWNSLRQATWEKLTNAGEGKIPFEAQALSQRLHEFLNGSGSQLATVLYTPKELGLMKQLASVYKQMIPVRGTTNPSGTAPMLAKIANGARHALLPLLGFTSGGLPGAAIAVGLDKGVTAIGNASAARRATSLFYGEQAKRAIDPRFARGAGVLSQGSLPAINQRRAR